MTETKTNVRQIRDESATTLRKTRKKKATNSQKANIDATSVQHIRYVYAPLLQQFRAHTKKNEARLWIPIETNLISRYEFATLTTHTRYIFVAILLYCAGNGIDEIPLDAKFMSSVLNVDFRAIEKSFDELLFVNLLQERKEKTEEKRKEQTDRQDEIALDARVSVDDFNSFSEVNPSEEKTENENGLLNESSAAIPQTAKIFENENQSNKNSIENQSKFSIEECKRYVELEIKDGATIQNANALAMKLFKTGQSDAFIFNKLFPKEAELAAAQTFGEPIKFLDEPCSICFGAKMSDTEGKGFRACNHCKNEKGKATGKEPIAMEK